MQTSFLSQTSQDLSLSRELHITSEVDSVVAPKRAFHFWRGSQSFYLNGALLHGPRALNCFPPVAAAVLCLWVAFFFHSLLPRLPFLPKREIGACFACLVSLLVYFALRTALTEPGVLPHAAMLRVKSLLNLGSPDNLRLYDFMVANQGELTVGQPPLDLQPDSEDATGPRFCSFCQVCKPPEAFHCVSCNCCVRGLSHHCLFVNNCIGRRNKRLFLATVFCLMAVDFYFLMALMLVNEFTDLTQSMAVKVLFFCFIFTGILVFGFCAFHLLGFAFSLIKHKTGKAEGETEGEEKGDFCGQTESMVLFQKELSAEEEKMLVGA